MAEDPKIRDNSDVKVINVGQDFSRFPSGRFRSDGDFSGQVFREEFILPALKCGKKLKIALDSAMGYGSSFLEEAFGGLVRENKLDPNELKNKLEFVTKKKSVEKEIWSYIDPSK